MTPQDVLDDYVRPYTDNGMPRAQAEILVVKRAIERVRGGGIVTQDSKLKGGRLLDSMLVTSIPTVLAACRTLRPMQSVFGCIGVAASIARLHEIDPQILGNAFANVYAHIEFLSPMPTGGGNGGNAGSGS